MIAIAREMYGHLNLCGGRSGIFVGLWLRITLFEFHHVDPWKKCGDARQTGTVAVTF